MITPLIPWALCIYTYPASILQGFHFWPGRVQYGLLPRLVFEHTSGHLHWISLILLIGRHRSPSFHFSSVAPCLCRKNSDGQTSLCNLNNTWNIIEIMFHEISNFYHLELPSDFLPLLRFHLTNFLMSLYFIKP